MIQIHSPDLGLAGRISHEVWLDVFCSTALNSTLSANWLDITDDVYIILVVQELYELGHS